MNNNVVICCDNSGRELIAFGRGLGFAEIPYEITDMSRIQRTFYNVSPQYLEMMNTLPADIVEFSSEIVDYARSTLPYELSPNLLLTLADHISFAIERKKKNIILKVPLAYDLEYTYPQESALARKILISIWKRFHVHLPDNEAFGIVMAFVNARVYQKDETSVKIMAEDQNILQEITDIIENELHTKIDRTQFNYVRYATHVQYLLERLRKGESIDSSNQDAYISLCQEYPDTAACVDSITRYLKGKYHFDVTEEEQLYLLLHVNRVCTNEKT
ncbi:MAG: PRD domain-containing protein [Lachnospiraceae bacterium]|nr:PRD domain-containing protein [Lachnospiraceae bacterium]